METVGTVLIWLGLLVALVLGALLTLGVIPLDQYLESYHEKKRRERRARESLGRSTSSRQ